MKSFYQKSWLVYLFCIVAISVVGAVAWCLFIGNQSVKANLVFAAGPEEGIYFKMAGEIAGILESKHPGLGIEVIESNGSGENARLIESGKADLALIQNDTPAGSEVKAVVPTHMEFLHLVARKDAEIRGWADLEGMRIVTGPESSGSFRIVRALLVYFSILEKVDLIPLDYEDARAALLEGEADLFPLMYGFRAPYVQNLFKQSSEVELLKLNKPNESALLGFFSTYPSARSVVIPPLSYGSEPPETAQTIGVETVFVASEKLPRSSMHLITETLFRERSQLVRLVPQASYLSEGFSKESLSFPIHEGASDYYDRNKPGFFVKYAEAMAFGLSVLLAIYGLAVTIRGWISQHRKNRIDAYYLKLEEHLNSIRSEVPLSAEEVNEIQESIRQVRHEAFQQLSDEKLKPDASFRILQHLLEECDEAFLSRGTNSRGSR